MEAKDRTTIESTIEIVDSIHTGYLGYFGFLYIILIILYFFCIRYLDNTNYIATNLKMFCLYE